MVKDKMTKCQKRSDEQRNRYIYKHGMIFVDVYSTIIM